MSRLFHFCVTRSALKTTHIYVLSLIIRLFGLYRDVVKVLNCLLFGRYVVERFMTDKMIENIHKLDVKIVNLFINARDFTYP